MKILFFVLCLFVVGVLLARWLMNEPVRRALGPGLVLSYGIIATTCFLGHNNWLLLIVCFGAFFIGVRSRFDAVCRFLLLTLLTPPVSYAATLAGRYVGSWQPLTMYGLALSIAYLIFGGRTPGRQRFSREDVAATVLLLILAFGSSHEFGPSDIARAVVGTGITMALPYFILTRSVTNRQDLSILLGVAAAGGVLLATFACYEAVHGWSLFDTVWQHYEPDTFMSRNRLVRSGFLRVPTTFLNSTVYAVFAVVALSAAAYSRDMFRTAGRWRLACLLLLFVLIAAQSRGALIGLAAAAIVTPALRRNYGRAALLAIGAAVAAGNLLLMAQFSQRAASFVEADAALRGDDYRQRLLRRGFELTWNYPVFGPGTANLKQLLPDLIQGENIVDLVNSYISILLAGGFVGLITFVVPVVISILKLRQLRIAARDRMSRQVLDAVASAFVGVLVTLFFTSFVERNPLWLLFGLACIKIAGRPAAVRSSPPSGTGQRYHEVSERMLVTS